MKKQSIIIVLILMFFLILIVGYALFSESINVQGTAIANATMDVEFTTATVSSEVGSVSANASISQDKNTLTITVPQLQYPGAYATTSVTVTNVGTMPVKLISVTPTNSLPSNMNLTYTNLDDYVTNQTVINVNGTHTFNVKVEWNPNSTTAFQAQSFSLVLTYEQAL